MKDGEHGVTPCSGVIQRNRRDALCFKGYVIWSKFVAIIDHMTDTGSAAEALGV